MKRGLFDLNFCIVSDVGIEATRAQVVHDGFYLLCGVEAAHEDGITRIHNYRIAHAYQCQ